MPNHRFFFVCGHSRSGTTWVERVLDLHPRINCKGEFHLEVVRRGFDELVGRAWHLAAHEPMKSIAEGCFQETVVKMLGSISKRKPDATWIGDRTPRPLRPLLPGCPHILMVRDGRDVAVSFTIHQLRTRGLETQQEPWRSVLRDDADALERNPLHFEENPDRLFANEGWVRHVAGKWAARCENDLAGMDRFKRGEWAGTGLMCRYEDLHAEPETERAKLYRFLDVDPRDAEALSKEEGTAPGLEAHNPIGKNRKGDVGDWKRFAGGARGDAFRRAFKEEAGAMLVRLGYEKGSDW